MATYFNVEKKEFCEALETFLKEWFKEGYTGKSAGGTFVGKVGVNKTSHFPAYFTIQVVEKNSECYKNGIDKNHVHYSRPVTMEELERDNSIIPSIAPYNGESAVARYKKRREEVQKEKKERVQKILSVLTTEEKKELFKAFLDDIQNETEED